MDSYRAVIHCNLVRLLDQSDLKLIQIQRLMNVSNSTIQRWKKGTQFPEPDKMDQLATILRVSPLEFFRIEDPPVSKPLPMSEIAKRIASVPDEVYDMAMKLTPDHEAWEHVIKNLRYDVEKMEKKKAKVTEEKKEKLG